MARTPPDPRAARPADGAVWRGVGYGLFLAFVAPALFVVALLSTGSTEGPWGNVVPFVLPAVGLVVLLVPRWRRGGAGLVMGMAIGSIVFAGVCGAWIATVSR